MEYGEGGDLFDLIENRENIRENGSKYLYPDYPWSGVFTQKGDLSSGYETIKHPVIRLECY